METRNFSTQELINLIKLAIESETDFTLILRNKNNDKKKHTLKFHIKKSGLVVCQDVKYRSSFIYRNIFNDTDIFITSYVGGNLLSGYLPLSDIESFKIDVE